MSDAGDLPSYADTEQALLLYLAQVGTARPRDVYDPLAEILSVSRADRQLLRSDGKGLLWPNRVQWARKSLKDKGLLSEALQTWSLSEAGVYEANQNAAPDNQDSDLWVDEGSASLRLHMLRERSPALIAKFKSSLSSFACTVCNFDFERRYGELGRTYIEAHHTIPIASLGEAGATRLRDLAAVCANCHRMLHRSGLVSIEELRSRLR